MHVGFFKTGDDTEGAAWSQTSPLSQHLHLFSGCVENNRHWTFCAHSKRGETGFKEQFLQGQEKIQRL